MIAKITVRQYEAYLGSVPGSRHRAPKTLVISSVTDTSLFITCPFNYTLVYAS